MNKQLNLRTVVIVVGLAFCFPLSRARADDVKPNAIALLQDCGPRAVAIALRQLGINEELLTLVDEIQPNKKEFSCMEDLRLALVKRGVNVYPISLGKNTILQTNNPVIVHLQSDRSNGHFAVLSKSSNIQWDDHVLVDCGNGSSLEGKWKDVHSLCSPEVLVVSNSANESISSFFRIASPAIEFYVVGIGSCFALCWFCCQFTRRRKTLS